MTMLREKFKLLLVAIKGVLPNFPKTFSTNLTSQPIFLYEELV